MTDAIQPMRIEVPEEVLDDLRERLARTRFPDQIPGSGWDYGTDGRLPARARAAYWRDKFDWRAQEAAAQLASSTSTPTIDGQQRPLPARALDGARTPSRSLITHGWPGSVFEFHKIIGPLTDPAAHGGDARDAFHVVCPSMPGYGFSGADARAGWDVRRMAEMNAKLMARLGYASYGAQGGDWGAIVTTLLSALVDPQHCARHPSQHGGRRARRGGVANPMEGVYAEELEGPRPTSASSRRTRPATSRSRAPSRRRSATGSTIRRRASPAGSSRSSAPGATAAATSRSASRKDELLTNIMIYWVTETINSSTRLYCETMRSRGASLRRASASRCRPAARSSRRRSPAAARAGPRAQYNVQQWTTHAVGRPLRRARRAGGAGRGPPQLLPQAALATGPPAVEDRTPRRSEKPLRLLRTALGGPREIRGKLARAGRTAPPVDRSTASSSAGSPRSSARGSSPRARPASSSCSAASTCCAS